MKILKYKKLKNGKYAITTDEEIVIELYEDVILKNNLLLTKKISDLEKVLKDNNEYDTYYQALKYIKTRLRSTDEVKKYLLKKEFEIDNIDKSIEKLQKQGYLNDLVFARSFFHEKLITTSYGPYKIKKSLLEKGISTKIIDEVLLEYDEDTQIEKISKRVSKMIKSNRNKSNNFLKKKIYNELTLDGFSKSLVASILEKSAFVDDKELYEKEYNKIYNKLSKKYSGKDLEYRVNQKMYQKGFSKE